MKLIIAGATGLLGTELLRQSLRNPAVTSVVALGRRPASLPDGADAAKLKNVVVEDFGRYPEEAKREFAGADACIWYKTIAITIPGARNTTPAVATRVCQTYAATGLRTLAASAPARPLRFLYVSGFLAERDQTKKPAFMPEYFLMRGQTENMLLEIGEESGGAVEVGIARPGYVRGPCPSLKSAAALAAAPVLEQVSLEACAAAMLEQAVHGLEAEIMENGDLRRVGGRALAGGGK